MGVKEKVFRSPIVVLVEYIGFVRLEGYPPAHYRGSQRDPWGLEDYGGRYQMKILCVFKYNGAPELESDVILVDAEAPCTEGEWTRLDWTGVDWTRLDWSGEGKARKGMATRLD